MSGAYLERRQRAQRGAAAVEFALIFPALFLLLYGTIVYGFVLFLQQSLNFAAQEAAQAAVAVNPTQLASGNTGSYIAAIENKASLSVLGTGGLLSWLPPTLKGNTTVTATVLNGTGTGASTQLSLRVKVTTTGVSAGCGGSGAFLPTVCLPVIGAAPPLPTQLSAYAVVGI